MRFKKSSETNHSPSCLHVLSTGWFPKSDTWRPAKREETASFMNFAFYLWKIRHRGGRTGWLRTLFKQNWIVSWTHLSRPYFATGDRLPRGSASKTQRTIACRWRRQDKPGTAGPNKSPTHAAFGSECIAMRSTSSSAVSYQGKQKHASPLNTIWPCSSL